MAQLMMLKAVKIPFIVCDFNSLANSATIYNTTDRRLYHNVTANGTTKERNGTQRGEARPRHVIDTPSHFCGEIFKGTT